MSKQPLKVIAGAPDRPLVIAGIEIPCYVLEDETRVLTQSGFLKALGRAPTSGSSKQLTKLPSFLAAANLKLFISKDLIKATTPIWMKRPFGRDAIAYQAISLPRVCEIYLQARDEGILQRNQQHVAKRADLIIRGLADVGIIALVDEVTGYQKIRSQHALADIFEAFLAKELQSWALTFSYEFYEQIFRLQGWDGPEGTKRPKIIGQFTCDIVYDRLAPGVLEELRQCNPKTPKGHRKARHHQLFTPEMGHPKLKEHLAAVIALMRASANWTQFMRALNRALPLQPKPSK